jgi:hypothetical protein
MFSPSHRQRHLFVLQLVQFFLNLFCLCSFYDTVPVEKESEHASAFQQFIDSIRDDLFVNKKAFSMSFLLDKFCSFLPPNIASKYTTSKLQQKLLNYFGNAIIVEKQCGQGKSNTVFSSSITVSEASMCCLNAASDGGSLTREESFDKAN